MRIELVCLPPAAALCILSRPSAEPRWVRPVPVSISRAGSGWSIGASSRPGVELGGEIDRLVAAAAPRGGSQRRAGGDRFAARSRVVSTPESDVRGVALGEDHAATAVGVTMLEQAKRGHAISFAADAKRRASAATSAGVLPAR